MSFSESNKKFLLKLSKQVSLDSRLYDKLTSSCRQQLKTSKLPYVRRIDVYIISYLYLYNKTIFFIFKKCHFLTYPFFPCFQNKNFSYISALFLRHTPNSMYYGHIKIQYLCLFLLYKITTRHTRQYLRISCLFLSLHSLLYNIPNSEYNTMEV